MKKNHTNTEILGQANTDSQCERRHIERKFAEQGTPLIQPPQPPTSPSAFALALP